MEPLTLEELPLLTTTLSSPASQSDLFSALKRKREIISNPAQSLPVIFQALSTEGQTQQLYLLALDLIFSISTNYFSSISVDDIVMFLLALPEAVLSSDIIIRRASTIISSLSVDLFRFTEENWMFPLPSAAEASPLLITSLQYVTENIQEECEDVPGIMRRQKINFFAENFAPQLLQLGVDLLLSNQYLFNAIGLLKSVIDFMKNERKGRNMENAFSVLNQMATNPVFIGKIMELDKNNSIEILGSLTSALKKNKNAFKEIIECVSLIQSSPDNFADVRIAKKYGELVMDLDMSSCPEIVPVFTQNVIIILRSFLENDLEKFCAVFEGISSYLLKIIRFVDVRDQIFEFVVAFINVPVEKLPVINDNSEETKKGFSNLFQIVDQNAAALIDIISKRLGPNYVIPMSRENDLSICFCLLLLKAILSINGRGKNAEAVSICLKVAMEFITMSNQHIGEIVANIGDQLSFEKQLISLESTIIKNTFQKLQTSNSNTEINQSQIAEIILNRLMLDILFNGSIHEAKEVIELFLQTPRAMECVCETNFPAFFLGKYKEIPVHKIVFKVLIQLVLISPMKQTFLKTIGEEFQGVVNNERLIYLLRMMSGFFDGSLTVNDWNELYNFSTKHLIGLFDEVSKSDACDSLLHYLFILLKNFPKSNPFTKHRANEFNFIKSTALYLINITNFIAERAEAIEIDESMFKESISFTAFENRKEGEQFVVHNNSANDKLWEMLEKVTKSCVLLFKNPCVNLGIMKYYKDSSFLDLWASISMVAQKTSIVSLQAFPSLVSAIVEYLSKVIVEYCDDLMSEEQAPFIFTFIKSVFLSNNVVDIDNACFILQSLTKYGYENVRPHFILTFNYVRNASSISMEILNFFFLVIDNDREFFNSIVEMIVADVGEYGEVVGSVLSLLTTEEDYETRYQQFASNLANFPVIIDSLPSLAEYFVF